jgi:hypothetical protein
LAGKTVFANNNNILNTFRPPKLSFDLLTGHTTFEESDNEPPEGLFGR